jgi:ketol-acid reductoisomerase
MERIRTGAGPRSWRERGKVADIFYDADADLRRLEGRTVAVVDYGIQGRAQALNMRDSGVENIVVGSVPDAVAPVVYEEHVGPALGTVTGKEE